MLKTSIFAAAIGLTFMAASITAADEAQTRPAPTTRPHANPLADPRKKFHLLNAEVTKVDEHSMVVRFQSSKTEWKSMVVEVNAGTTFGFATYERRSAAPGRANSPTLGSVNPAGPATWADIKPGVRVMTVMPEGVQAAEGVRFVADGISIIVAGATTQPTTQPAAN